MGTLHKETIYEKSNMLELERNFCGPYVTGIVLQMRNLKSGLRGKVNNTNTEI